MDNLLVRCRRLHAKAKQEIAELQAQSRAVTKRLDAMQSRRHDLQAWVAEVQDRQARRIARTEIFLAGQADRLGGVAGAGPTGSPEMRCQASPSDST